MVIEVLIVSLVFCTCVIISDLQLIWWHANRDWGYIPNFNLWLLLSLEITQVLIVSRCAYLVWFVYQEFRRPRNSATLVLKSLIIRNYVDNVSVASRTFQYSTSTTLENVRTRLGYIPALSRRGRKCTKLFVIFNDLLACSNPPLLKLLVLKLTTHVVWLVFLDRALTSYLYLLLLLIYNYGKVAIAWVFF